MSGNAVESIVCMIGLKASLGVIALRNSIKRKLFAKKSSIIIAYIYIGCMGFIFTHMEALIVLLFIVLFLYYNIMGSKESKEEFTFDKSTLTKAINTKNIILFVAGAAGIVIATSVPELTTMLSSIKKKNQDIGLGNISGANILNVALILTSSSLISKEGLPIQLYDINILGKAFTNYPNTLKIDVPFVLLLMLIFSVPTFIKGETKKWQVFAMLATYVIYLVVRVGTGIS